MRTPPAPSSSPAPAPAVRPSPALHPAGTVVTLLAAGAQVLAGFHRWDVLGRVGLDVPLVAAVPSLLNVGTALLVLAALPSLAALVTAGGWPRFVSAVGTAGLVLWWVATGPAGPVAAGVWLAVGATCAHLVAAALARP